MNEIFEEIYDSLRLESLPGIVSFQAVTGQPLQELVAANESLYGTLFSPENYQESIAGGSLEN